MLRRSVDRVESALQATHNRWGTDYSRDKSPPFRKKHARIACPSVCRLSAPNRDIGGNGNPMGRLVYAANWSARCIAILQVIQLSLQVEMTDAVPI